MPKPRAFRVTIYLDDVSRTQIDRLWNTLMALDSPIIEEHPKAGSLIVETSQDDEKVFLRVPGVTAVRSVPITDHGMPAAPSKACKKSNGAGSYAN